MIWAPPRRAASRFQVLNFLFNPLILANYLAIGEGHTDQVYLAVRHDPWDIQDHHIDLVYKATLDGAGLSIPTGGFFCSFSACPSMQSTSRLWRLRST